MHQNDIIGLPVSTTISSKKLWRFSLAALFFTLLSAIFSRTGADPDLWGHLRFGLDVLETGSIPQWDPYSYLSAGHLWINHEWLAEVIFALAWNLMGVSGLSIVQLAIALLISTVLYRSLSLGNLSLLRRLILLALFVTPLFPSLGNVRPHLFTLLFFALTVSIITYGEEGYQRRLWMLPFLFALWVNLHGGFLAGIGILGVWSLVHILYRPQAWRHIILVLSTSLAATLLNPYGIELLLFLFRTATVPRPEIIEWIPLRPVSLAGLTYLIVFCVSIAGLIKSRQARSPALVAVFCISAIMPFVAERHLALFGSAALLTTGKHIADAWSQISPRVNESYPVRLWKAGVPLIAAFALIPIVITNLRTIPFRQFAFTYPVNAVALLKESGVSGNLAVEFNWGEYVIWHLSPQIKVSMDGRRETVYPEHIYQEYLQFVYGIGDWKRLLTAYPTDMVLVSKSSAAYNLMRHQADWQLSFEDSNSALFARSGSVMAAQLSESAPTFNPPLNDLNFP